jgi:hypothetical protein
MIRSAAAARPLADTEDWAHLHCSFCGKDGNHVRFLTAGVAGGKICDVCCWKALFIFLRTYLTPRRFRRV